MKLFVYGHYDSRGGTSAVIADSRDQADAMYLDVIYGDDRDDYYGPDEIQGLLDEDYLGEAILEGELPFVPGTTRLDHDLEQYGVVLAPIDRSQDGDPEGDFPPDFSAGPVRLLFVPAEQVGDEPPEGWYHPRWDDDAFGFMLVAEGAL